MINRLPLDVTQLIHPEDEEDHIEGHRDQTLRGAQRLLEHYNSGKGTNYELVEALRSGAIMMPDGIALHCNFTAKPANQDSGSSIKLFFGEMLIGPDDVDKVTYCDILNGKSHGSKDCGENADIKHPPAELLTRSYYDVSDTIREMSPKRCATVPLNSAKKQKTLEYGSSNLDNEFEFDAMEYPQSPVCPPYEYPEDEEDHIEGHRRQTLRGAQRLLDHYNNEKGTNYELVEAVTSGAIMKPDGIALHCNFTAKPANQDSDSSIKLFFGEMLIGPNDFHIVTYCDILNGKSHGCKDCGENADIKHPPAELLTRSYYDVSDTIREMSPKRCATVPINSAKKEKTLEYGSSNLDNEFEFDAMEYPQSPVCPPYEYPEDEEYHIEGHRRQTLRGAQRLLEHYNNEKGTNYELVEALTSGAIMKPDGIALHCNFTAKPANQDSDSSIKLFFGEMLIGPNDVHIVTYCDILNGKSHGCKECGENADIKHPPAELLTRSYDDVSDTIPEMSPKSGGATPMDSVKEKTRKNGKSILDQGYDTNDLGYPPSPVYTPY
ncbi:uncharacterized protein LOC130806030 isoform X1 [Amaranthus tricolor]|uniref:uncharacterized protein LOC130806006 n=2 Tax=Amaranthus tricolor TaxID=29722 RepID=UPI00258F60D2|nr:uncharacterized protein LOC130806006 [Amaranthus tricolor]XP_057526904.1 uncharacterized protein LOC130806030 isoform X1 [Amaranthus tricolor]